MTSIKRIFLKLEKIVDEESDPDTIYIGIPCSYLINR